MMETEEQIRAYGPVLRRIEHIGQVCLAGWVGVLVALGVTWPEPFAMVWRLVLGQMMAGRAFSIGLGLDLGFPKWFLLLQCSIQDILLLLLFYPLLIAGYRRVVEMRIVGPAIANIRASAERHKSKVEPFGAVGLMLFVLFPFWSTGPLAGGVVGYMLGIRTWLSFTAIIAGNFLSVGCWILFFDYLSGLLMRSGTKLPVGLPLMMLVTVIVLAGVYRAWQLRKHVYHRIMNGRAVKEEDGD